MLFLAFDTRPCRGAYAPERIEFAVAMNVRKLVCYHLKQRCRIIGRVSVASIKHFDDPKRLSSDCRKNRSVNSLTVFPCYYSVILSYSSKNIFFVLIILVILFAIPGCLPACEKPETSTLSAPERSHIAYVVHQLCDAGLGNASDSYTVSVGNATDRPDNATIVFSTWDFAPEIRWAGAKNLNITLSNVTDIGDTSHKVIGVNITYEVKAEAEKKQVVEVLNKLDDFIDSYKKGPGSNKSTDSPTSLVGQSVMIRRQRYEKFLNWINSNVDQH